MTDDQRRACEQTYQELLAVVARLDVLRRRGQGEVEPLATAAMYAAGHAAWNLWHTLRPDVAPPVFADGGERHLELARTWAAEGRACPTRAETEAAKAAILARGSGL